MIRFVFWNDITNDCTIGDQLKTANTSISGRANSRFATPPPRIAGCCGSARSLRRAGLRRAPCEGLELSVDQTGS